MIYLDYSATTPVREEVMDSFCKTSREYIGNANSLHQLGVKSKHLMDAATKQIATLLHVNPSEIIYTSGATESNNLAIFGVVEKYQNRGKHILTTPLEHSSILEPCRYLEKRGFEIEYIPLLADGTVDFDRMQQMVREDTILVTLASVSSELGILQPIEAMGEFLKNYPKCFFHVDMTQSIGKVNLSFENIDLASFSAHKFYGLKGIGCLVKKDGKEITPILHGGKSTTIYRSGTPALPLIVSLAKALRFALIDLDVHIKKVTELSNYLVHNLKKIDGIIVNHPASAIPHIVNFSVMGVKPETMLHALEQHEIYISTQTACSKEGSYSEAVYAYSGDNKKASTSMRVSISHLSTKEEIDTFLTVLKKEYQHLSNR